MSADEHLFATKVRITPARVSGTFRRIKWRFMAVLLSLYYILPWIRWDRGPGAPDQAILIDIAQRKFYFFFIELWPQEIYYFTGLLLLAGISLFFITTLLGRVWCGYACPQTVWTDLFVLVERFVEGDRNKRLKLRQSSWTIKKISKRTLKHTLWLLIGLLTGGAWVFYFQDAPTLWQDMLNGQFYITPTFWILFLTLTTYIMAGHARESVCTYMCPYARFQGSMFDEFSLIVAYDTKRGEPRGKEKNAGDCVDCNRCVAVCPMGIDIRDGQQLQCINCALCVDACNAVMKKLDRETGLIRYNTLNNIVPSGSGLSGLKGINFLRPRIVYYASFIAIIGGGMVYGLSTRPLMEFNVMRDRNPLYVLRTDGTIRNTYTLHLVNKTWQKQAYTITTPNFPTAKLSTNRIGTTPPNQPPTFAVAPGKVGTFKLFVDTPLTPSTPPRLNFTLNAAATNTINARYKTLFIAPKQ